MNGHDPDAVDGFVAEHYVNHNTHVEEGREANRAFRVQWSGAFPDTSVILEDVLIDGNRVAGRSPYEATFAGAFMGIPRRARASTCIPSTSGVVNGTAVEHWDQIDGLAFFAQLTEDNSA